MASIFDKVSTRMFCISGTLNDIFCTPDLRLYSFEELLNEKLKSLGYKNIVFYSGAKERMFAMDSECGSKLSELTKKSSGKPASESTQSAQPARSVQSAAPSRTVLDGVQRTVKNKTADTGNSKNVYHISAKENAAPDMANHLMLNTGAGKTALVFTSLDDFLKNTSRAFFAYFEDWRSLPNDNGNICIFVSKSIEPQNLQVLFENPNSISMRSLFVKGTSSGTATFNHNSCLIIGSPLGDEILNLLEYLRIKGYTYIYRGENNGDVTVTKRLSFSESDVNDLVKALSYFNRESDFSELKTIKETLEAFMRESCANRVRITPDDIPPLYGQNPGSFNDEDDDPLELLKKREGWETAGEIVGGFIDNYRANYKTDTVSDSGLSATQIERFEPGSQERRSRIKVPNFVLQGNPGVGKTEIANLIGRILQNEGILKSGHTVIATRDKLVGQYVGSTAVQTAALIEQAQEGVLLVDEVYTLAEGENNSASYCSEAINTLVAAMTNKNYHFCVIFAGYANRMDEVWKMNEGLFSRFGEANIITINEYKPPLLRKIFENSVTRKDDTCKPVVISDDVKDGLPEFFNNLYSDRDTVNFGNARDMNNLADTVKRRAGIRHLRDDVITIERVDFGDKEKLFEKRGFSTAEIYSKLDDYIGLDFLKEMFSDQLALKIECEEKGLEYPGPSHMIWAGNPGTGKSTAAQLTAELYHSLGIFGSDKPIYVDASNLVGQYVGHSEKNINDKMDEAIQHHTILVVEEAYQLAESDFGKHVIDAMLNKMETNRRDFSIIFIVYSDRVEQFLNCNPGLESRLQRYDFKDYTPDQLFDIFELMCKKNRDTSSESAKTAVWELFKKLFEDKLSGNGNARIVRKLLDEMRRNRYRRIQSGLSAKMGISPSEIAIMRSNGKLRIPEDAYVFEPEDVPETFYEQMKRYHGR